jgi:FkbM family methyltransferase
LTAAAPDPIALWLPSWTRQRWDAAGAQRPASFALDVGANVGREWPHVASIMFNAAPVADRLLAFEAFPPNAELCAERLRNGSASLRQWVTLVRAAVGRAPGSLEFATPRRAGPGTQLGFLNTGPHDNHKFKYEQVPVVTLDDVVVREAAGRALCVPFAKIDTEGFDGAVLAGGALGVLPSLGMVVWECREIQRRAGDTLNFVAEMLARAGFETYKLGVKQWLRMDGELAHPSFDDTDWSNCVSLRRGHPMRPALLRGFVAPQYAEGTVAPPGVCPLPVVEVERYAREEAARRVLR